MHARTRRDPAPPRGALARRPRTRTRRAVGLLLPLALAACSAGPNSTPENLVVVVFDALRADRLGAYGNAAARTPQLDAFAGEAVLFERALTPAPHSVSSHASLFTSLHPASHGVWQEVYRNGVLSHPKLTPAAVTLAETLRAEGFQTAAVADGPPITAARGLLQGFDFVDSEAGGAHDRADAAIRWLDGRDSSRPFFLFLHTAEADVPYLPPGDEIDRLARDYRGALRTAVSRARDWRRRNPGDASRHGLHRRFFGPLFAHADAEDAAFLLALHDAEVALADAAFGRVLARLSSEGLTDASLVIVTASHGAEFLEHGAEGQAQLYREVVQVPLLVRTPQGAAGQRRSDAVGLVDLMPTALTALGVAIPESAQGRSIDLGATEGPGDRMLIAESSPTGRRWASVWGPEQHAVLREGDPQRVAVFDIADDPAEAEDLSGTDPGRAFVARAREALAAQRAEALAHQKRFGLAPRFDD